MHVYSMREKGLVMRCDAAQASHQGKYSPAFKGSWLRVWTAEAMEISSLLSWKIVSCFLLGEKETEKLTWSFALLCSLWYQIY